MAYHQTGESIWYKLQFRNSCILMQTNKGIKLQSRRIARLLTIQLLAILPVCHLFLQFSTTKLRKLSTLLDLAHWRLTEASQPKKLAFFKQNWRRKIFIFWLKFIEWIYSFGSTGHVDKVINVCTRVTNCFSAHERVILVFISGVAKQRGK